MKNLIEFLGNGQCYKCGGTITVVENEITEIELDPSGMPIDFSTKLYNVHGECRECGTKFFNMEKVDMSYRPVNRLKKLVPTLDLVEKLELNPFGYKKNER